MNSPEMPSAQAAGGSPHRAVASAWHAVVVLVVLLGFSLAGARAGNATPIGGAHGRPIGYVLIMMMEWSLVAFIGYGVQRRGLRLRDLVGGSWARPVHALRDLGIAVAFLVLSQLILGGLGYLLKAAPSQALRNLLPQSPVEIALYLLVALTAGFCEELIFRGYLQRQFAALTQASAGGIVLQAIAFGAGHGYQGWKFMLVIAVFGSMFGLLAHWRRSLRPGMMAHFLQDGVGGLLGRHFLR